MKSLLATMVLVLLVVSSQAEELWPLLPDRSFQAVVIPAESAKSDRYLAKRYTDFWSPSAEQIALAEKQITDRIVTACNVHAQLELRLRARDNPAYFVRQYVGGVRGGRRVIFCAATGVGLANHRHPNDWRRHLLIWADASDDWTAEYDLADDICRGIHFDSGY